MKKSLKYFLSLILILVVMLSALGCNFIVSDPPDTGDEPPTTPSYGCEVDLPDSIQEAESIKLNTFTPIEREESDMTLEEAVSLVKRSSVAIMTDAGNASGTIIDIDDGVNDANVFYILTCHHVIVEARTVMVYVADPDYRYAENEKYTFTGKIGGDRTADQAVSLVGGDFKSDVAVLKLYVQDDDVAKTIVKAKIMDDDYSCTEGQTVFAIGNPTGILPGSVTSGVIAYVNRTTSVEDIGDMTLLQIGVSISPGSSGGALFNLYGELVGITNAGNASKLTFYAIPHRITQTAESDLGFINIAKQLIATCTDDNYGYVSGRKQTIGFTISQVQGSYSTTYVSVTAVIPGSQAELQGLKTGDVIMAIEVKGVKTDVSTIAGCSEIIDGLKPTDTFTFYVLRDNLEHKINLTIYQEYFRDTGVYPQPNS